MYIHYKDLCHYKTIHIIVLYALLTLLIGSSVVKYPVAVLMYLPSKTTRYMDDG